MGRLRLRRGARAESGEAGAGVPPVPLEPGALVHMFASPQWLRDLGRMAWYLVGLALVLVGGVWLLGTTSSIVEPVLAAIVLAAVSAPAVSWLARRHGVPRALGAGLVLLGLVAVGAVVVLLVVSGITASGAEIQDALARALDRIEGWARDAGASGTADVKDEVKDAVPEAGRTLLHGVAGGISGLTSLAFFLSFLALSTFFLLKDGPTFRRFVDAHLGIPRPVATIVTGRVLGSLRSYFLGVTIVAAFNAVVVGLGALALGVSLPGTIAIVTFVTAYVPYIGAVVSGTFAVLLALADEGTGAAVAMLVIVVLANGALQQVVQPIAFGATLGLNPLVVLVVTVGAGALFGMVGLVLAAPLTSAAVHIGRDLAVARQIRNEEAAPAPPSGGATGAPP